MTLSADQLRRLEEWGIAGLSQVDDHPFAWWAVRGHEHVVVKAGDRSERAREAMALQALGSGASRVVDHDASVGLLVTQRFLPGDDIRPLARRDDDAATVAVATLAVRLHADQGPGRGLPALSQLGEVFDDPIDARLPTEVVQTARRTFDTLMADAPAAVVLHGDLQHLNVLRDHGTWSAIDPHGWMGDPAFEAAALIANPRGLVEEGDARGMDGRALAARSRRRTQIYAEVTGYDTDRLRAWGFVGCVVAELWMVARHDLVHGAPLALAEALLDEGI